MRLPPPDPSEISDPDPGLSVPAPMVVYLAGPPSPAQEAVADALLAARPGALFVAVRG